MDYYLAYDAPVGKREDGTFVMRKGRQKIDFCPTKDFASKVCSFMLRQYGRGTHWIEDEAGKTIWTGDDE